MPSKTLVMIGMFLGSIIGGYLPSFFGVSIFSLTALIASTIGAFLGIYIASRIDL